MAGEAQADEPFLIQQPRRFLQQRHATAVVLDQVVVDRQHRPHSLLHEQTGNSEKWKPANIPHVYMFCSNSRCSREQLSLLRWCKQEIAKKVRVDFPHIRPQMNRSLTEANALPFLHDRNVPGGRLTRENQVAWNRKRSLRPNLVDILRNSMYVSQIKATYTDVWRSNQGISSRLASEQCYASNPR